MAGRSVAGVVVDAAASALLVGAAAFGAATLLAGEAESADVGAGALGVVTGAGETGTGAGTGAGAGTNSSGSHCSSH